MDINELKRSAVKFVKDCSANYISPEDAMQTELTGMQIFDAPIFGVGSATDPMFVELKKPEIVGENVRLPTEWLPGARCVLSWFLPFTETVRAQNAVDMRWPSDEWLHGRIEGQMMNECLAEYICDYLRSEGFEAVAPMREPQYIVDVIHYTTNWTERHAAHICGLGTFGMHGSLITEKGAAGRFGSVITTAEFPVTPRPYNGPFDYCIQCGACAKHCPAGAINTAASMGHTKSHPKCAAFLGDVMQQPPRGKSMRKRYGCGKCLVGVPCTGKKPG
jgi:epoxyqueuosine reductase